jgi:hypothetical protein
MKGTQHSKARQGERRKRGGKREEKLKKSKGEKQRRGRRRGRCRTHPSSVYRTVHSPILEEYVRHMTLSSISPKRPDGQTVARESTVSILRHDPIRPVDHRNAIISIMAVIPIYHNILSCQIKTIRVLPRCGAVGRLVVDLVVSETMAYEWEGCRQVPCSIIRCSIDEMIRDCNVYSRHVESPSNWLDNLDLRDRSIRYIKCRELRAQGLRFLSSQFSGL